MSMETPKELFIHELQDIYDAEHRILQMLPLMAQESENEQVKEAFQHHEEETKQQVTNLEQCFEALGAKAKGSACHAVAGMKQEHDSFLKEKPSSAILVMYNLGGASKTEHYEIASYKDLVEQANLLGEKKVAQLLLDNLKQEEEMAKKVEQLSKQLGKKAAAQHK